ncbi:FkbM family methyltransferase [filamentous cyanobacterium LEGE 11480]|uniref:FkbM family methyltransferase n=1 Tax=Romeriopsis navalis LEGE 11480 TaxID=2777977 RepID=A0A928VLC2_9CYAN|nr:FkbM family methyltransferase [Romeriopsis navalis]MBE9030718.1 FkbM family methyltransferase [Romeriopsis navalis LEGE 11480]
MSLLSRLQQRFSPRRDIAQVREYVTQHAKTLKPKYEYFNETFNDRWIVEYAFPGKTGGYFIEAGAANGKEASSCYVLERHLGWQGLCIEPNIDFYQQLVKHRPNSICEQVCLSDQVETVSFILADADPDVAPYISGVKENLEAYKWEGDKIAASGREIELPAVPLEQLLRKHNAPKIIDYAAFDIEGSEIKVIESFPFEEYTCLALSVEADPWIWERMLTRLLPYGYQEVPNPFCDKPWEHYCLHESILNDQP